MYFIASLLLGDGRPLRQMDGAEIDNSDEEDPLAVLRAGRTERNRPIAAGVVALQSSGGAGHELSRRHVSPSEDLLRVSGRPEGGNEDPRVRFETLFRQNADAVLGYATRRSDPDAAQEVVAETFAVAWRRLDAVPDPPLAWLLGVARKVLANQRRSRARAESLTLRIVSGSVASADDPAEVVDARVSVQAAIDRLLPAEREVLELLAWEGLSPAQAAEALGCSRAAIAVRLHRARRRLLRLLGAPLDTQRSSAGSTESGRTSRDQVTPATTMKEANDAG
jgi:RNA polymerase sigma-70 factor (ECF subfamily)